MSNVDYRCIPYGKKVGITELAIRMHLCIRNIKIPWPCVCIPSGLFSKILLYYAGKYLQMYEGDGIFSCVEMLGFSGPVV